MAKRGWRLFPIKPRGKQPLMVRQELEMFGQILVTAIGNLLIYLSCVLAQAT
jgi:hypothetical protein